MNRILKTLFLSLLAFPLFSAEYTAMIMPKGGEATILASGAPLLSLGYYDWGPGWSGVARKSSGTEEGNTARFGYDNTLRKTNTSFTIDGTWKKPAATQLAFDATLTPGGSSDITMAQFTLTPGTLLQGTTATVHHADGSTTSQDVPFGRGTLGEAVTRLVFTDTLGKTTELRFNPAAAISMDRGDARLIIAQDRMEQGAPTQLAFTIHLPGEVDFLPGPVAAASKYNQQGWYVFEPPSPLPANSALRMNNWLHTPAGKYGRITQEGEDLMLNGSPIHLWGLNNSYAACAPDNEMADKRADFYSAMGVNAVRLHKYADGTGWAGILSKESTVEYDPEKLDRMDYFVNALKQKGIYTKLSPVFIVDIGPGDRDRIPYMDELGNMRGNRINPRHGSLYLSVELQDLLIDQVVKLMNHTNPYTGMRYADDPAIAYFELYNEDSSLFGGVSSAMARSKTLRQRGGEMFATWLKNKYPNKEAFLEAWGDQALNNSIIRNQKLPTNESWEENRIYPAGNPWFFDPDNLNTSQSVYKRRLLDTMAFLYDLQNHVYERYARAIRETGYDGELIASNWQAGRMMSHFYNLHSDAKFGTIDRHNYFGGGSRGTGPIVSTSMLAKAGSGSLSSSLQQVSEAPFMLSEWIHVLPNEWGAEGAAIIGAYGMGLQGWDVSYAFQNSDAGTFSTVLGGHPWDVTAPHFMGMFPAVSRQVHRQDVKESDVVHVRHVHVPSLDSQKVGFEERVTQDWDEKTFTSDVFPAEALAVAKGVVKFTDSFQPTERFDLTPYRQADTLVSTTGQLRWTEGESAMDGHIVIDTEGTQAVVGFANAESFDLSDAVIRPASRFGAIYLTAKSPDGTLKDDSILITAIARARNEKAVVVEDSLILSKGGMNRNRPAGPIVMEPVQASIDLKRSGTPTVHVLDQGGSKTGRTLPVTNGTFTIDTGRDSTPWYLVEW